jgi:hypothetical protein
MTAPPGYGPWRLVILADRAMNRTHAAGFDAGRMRFSTVKL